jgi:hypothetical protein
MENVEGRVTEKKKALEEPKNNLYILDKRTIYISIGVILILIAAVFFITRTALSDEICLDSSTGVIGDTIGGITSPIIGLIGAILVYLSFQEQIKANAIQIGISREQSDLRDKERNFDVNMDLFKQIKEDYQKISYANHFGETALRVYYKNIKNLEVRDYDDNLNMLLNLSVFSEYVFVMNEVYLLSYRLHKSKIKDEEDDESDENEQLILLILTFYSMYLKSTTEVILTATENNENFLAAFTMVNDIKEKLDSL